MLIFSFPGLEQGVAATLARHLRSSLIQKGADADHLKFARSSQNDMSLGDLLQLATSLDYLLIAEKGLTLAAIAHTLFD